MTASSTSPTTRDDERLIPVSTPEGEFRVWTRRIGDNPAVKVLVLHGGPGATHEYLANFEQHLPPAGFEMDFYDQLGSGPAWMADMARRLPRGRYLECPGGSHLAMWDDEETYFDGLLAFLRDVEAGRA